MEPYCTDWAQSLNRQTDSDFDLWIGVDQLSIAEIEKAAQQHLVAEFIFAKPGDTPAMIRNRALEQMVGRYNAIIFVDSDDILAATRVEAAKQFLQHYDVIGTAMHLIDQSGAPLNFTFSPPPMSDYTSILFRWNIFGLSNTAYRSEIVSRCLPIPPDCIAVDWYLATMSLLHGSRLGFDNKPQMYYRQHGANTARIIPPFTPEQVLNATRVVLQHQLSIFNYTEVDTQKEILAQAHQKVEKFSNNVLANSGMLKRYVVALNKLPVQSVWWSCVARAELEKLWNQ
jgi:hypothetical protein